MLIEKQNAPAPGDIITLKLLSGEEVIGRLVDIIGDTVAIAKPLQIIVQPINATQMGVGLRPLLGSVSETATIQFPLAGLMIRPIKTGDDMSRSYVQATTGLVTAGPSMLTP